MTYTMIIIMLLKINEEAALFLYNLQFGLKDALVLIKETIDDPEQGNKYKEIKRTPIISELEPQIEMPVELDRLSFSPKLPKLDPMLLQLAMELERCELLLISASRSCWMRCTNLFSSL